VFNTARIDPPPRQYCFVFRGKVFSYYSNHPHIGEKAGSKCKMRGCPTQAAFPLAMGCLNAIERHTADY
jgi:hypothetical protein